MSFRSAFLLALAALTLSSCSFVKRLFYGEKEQFDPCDPGYNYYDEGGQHYFHDELVRDDGTLDYERILKGLDPSNSPCDPLNSNKEKK